MHYVRTEAALRELVADWHRLSPSGRDAIMALLRTSQVEEAPRIHPASRETPVVIN